jgi:hypothetical protein
MQTFHGGVARTSGAESSGGKRSVLLLGGLAVVALLIGGAGAFAALRGKPGAGAVAGDSASMHPPVVPPSLGSVATTASVTGSVAIAPPPMQGDVDVKIIATPKNATIWLGDEKLGVAPGPVRVKRGPDKVTLTLKADGYAPATVDVVPTESSTVSNVKLTRVGGGVRPTPKPTGAAGEIESPDFK